MGQGCALKERRGRWAGEAGNFFVILSVAKFIPMLVLTLAARAVEAGVTDTGERPRTTVYTGTAVETRVAGTSAACNDNGSEGRSSNNTSTSNSL